MTKFESNSQRKITGINLKSTVLEEVAVELNSKIGHSYTDKGFISASLVRELNFFQKREVMLELEVPKGKKWLITENKSESEVVFLPGQTMTIKKAEAVTVDSEKKLKIVVALSDKP